MKFKRKIRQPKKAKKVTLAHIREIVKEELSALHGSGHGFKDITFHNAKVEYAGEEKPMYFPPSPIKPVPPPPRVSAKLANLPPLPLPDEYEVDEGESNAASK